MKKRVDTKNKVFRRNWYLNTGIIYIAIFFVILSISIAYSAINSTLRMTGTASIKAVLADIRMSSCTFINATNGGVEDYDCQFKDNIFISGVTLPNKKSTVTYEIEIINFTDIAMFLDKITNVNYNNNEIEYTLTDFKIGDMVTGISSVSFSITFKHTKNSKLTNISLGSQLEFEYDKVKSVLAIGSTGGANTKFLAGPLKKNQIEKISFVNGNNVPLTAISSWDAGYTKNGRVMAWYFDDDSNDLYEVYIGGINGVTAHANTSNLFRALVNVREIDFRFLDTSDSTNMSYMFDNCNSLENLDLSKFNTSNVTTMSYMFNSTSSLQELDVSSFDTTSLINMQNIFAGCDNLVHLDLSSFETPVLTNVAFLLSGVNKLKTLDLRNAIFTNVTNYNSTFLNTNALEEVYVNQENYDILQDSVIPASVKAKLVIV